MTKLIKISLASIALLFSSLTIAAPKCPSDGAIKAISLDAVNSADGGYIAYNSSYLSLGTPTLWIGAVGIIYTSSPSEALRIGKETIITATGPVTSEAMADEDTGIWICAYRTSNPQLVAVTVAPLDYYGNTRKAVSVPSPQKAIKAIQRFSF